MGDLLGFQKLNFLSGRTLCLGHAVYVTIFGVCTAGNYAQIWTTKLHNSLFLVLGSFAPKLKCVEEDKLHSFFPATYCI